jgi:hypothetical protein
MDRAARVGPRAVGNERAAADRVTINAIAHGIAMGRSETTGKLKGRVAL